MVLSYRGQRLRMWEQTGEQDFENLVIATIDNGLTDRSENTPSATASRAIRQKMEVRFPPMVP